MESPEMEKYVGTKLINAAPMTRQAYNDLRGWKLPEDENGDDEGYLVEYLDGGLPNVKGFAGYVSWSPAEVFERAYHTNGSLTFGEALIALKNGSKVCRAGWNGMKPITQRFKPLSREAVIFDGLTHVLLSDGSVAICDEDDYEMVSEYVWSADEKGYPYFTRYNTDGTRSTVKMHQLLNPQWEMIDHDNGDTTDNRRLNLRPCTSSQNNANRSSRANSTSKFKGVSWDSSREKWISSIQINRKTKHLGRFDNENSAAKAYDAAAVGFYGEFARLNFPSPRMWLSLSGYEVREIPAGAFWSENNSAYAAEQGGSAKVLPCITMKTATGEILMGWLASQSDMLAEDWVILE